MATDHSEPRIRLIATIAIIAVITLFGLDFVFKSYFAFMSDEAQAERAAPRTAYLAQVAAEEAAFAKAKVPMSRAIAQLKGARVDSIEPRPSDDLGAMTGWSKLPKVAPTSFVSPVAAHPAATMLADGGVLPGASMDGGLPGGDAGTAPKKPMAASQH